MNVANKVFKSNPFASDGKFPYAESTYHVQDKSIKPVGSSKNIAINDPIDTKYPYAPVAGKKAEDVAVCVTRAEDNSWSNKLCSTGAFDKPNDKTNGANLVCLC